TSSFVMTKCVIPLIRQACFRATKSNQPQRRGRPVEAPNSKPVFLICSPVSSSSSVGKGPFPTRVQYAFETPIRFFSFVGGTPAPVQTPPVEGDEEVT